MTCAPLNRGAGPVLGRRNNLLLAVGEIGLGGGERQHGQQAAE